MGTFFKKKIQDYLIYIVFLSICILTVSPSVIYGQNQDSATDKMSKIKWVHGPAQVSLGNIANINLPDGYLFADANETRIFLEATQNPPSGNELGVVVPNNGKWFALFEFSDIGYIKDDEKSSLDAEAILKTLKKGTERGNEERRKRGWASLDIVGWQQPPHYDSVTHNLEWAIRAQSGSEQIVNYNTKLLGRKGVMNVTLVCDPLTVSEITPDYKMIMANHEFSTGNRYAEFVKGDKIAEYGLTGLIVGGAAAAAAKAGVFKWLWKVLLVGAVAIGAFFKKIFGKKTE